MSVRRVCTVTVLLAQLAVATAGSASAADPVPPNRIPVDGQPTIAHLGLVQPDLLSITIVEGRNVRSPMQPYSAQPGDEMETPEKSYDAIKLRRGGQIVGVFTDAEKTWWRPNDVFQGRLIDPASLNDMANYQITTGSPPTKAVVESVSRKSTPLGYGVINQGQAPFENIVFLRLDRPLPRGETFRVACRWPELKQPGQFIELSHDFQNIPHQNRSIAVHVNQLGYHPGDPVKTAYLSCWTGDGPDGGNVRYEAGELGFAILDADTRTPVTFGDRKTGKVQLRRSRDQTEDTSWHYYAYTDTAPERYNASKVDVYDMDFSELTRPGRYVLYVENIGTSYPFVLQPDVWQQAFEHGIHGLYHQRSGIELDGRFGYARPQTFHPDPVKKPWDNPLTDRVEAMTVRPQTIHGSKLVRFTYPQDKVFEDIGRTDAICYEGNQKVEVPVWGGYMDAGDWDRHEMHLTPSYDLLDLADHFPAYFDDLDLNLPPSSDVLPDDRYDGVDLPDILDEALFTVDYFRRLQQPGGGVRSGMESTDHPKQAQPSWQEELDVYAYAADPKASYLYAAVAAKAAKVLARYDAELSAMFSQSATRAFDWTESQVIGPDGAMTFEPFLAASNLRNPQEFDYLIRGTPMAGPATGNELVVTPDTAASMTVASLQIVNGPYVSGDAGPIEIEGFGPGGESIGTQTIDRSPLGWYETKTVNFKDWNNVRRLVIRSEGPFRLKKLTATPAGAEASIVGFDKVDVERLVDAVGGLRFRSADDLPAVIESVFDHPAEVAPLRAWAAAELFRLTDEPVYVAVLKKSAEIFIRRDAADWHNFSSDTQASAAYAYATSDGSRVEPAMREVAIAMYTRYARQTYMADDLVAVNQKPGESRFNHSAFRQARHGWTPWIAGTGVTPAMGSQAVARSYLLTGDPAYLKSMVHGVQFGLGANPHNTVYTTGMGQQPVDNVLHCDSAALGCEPPDGYTVYGPSQIWMIPNPSWVLNFSKQAIHPNVYDWPVTENYHQIHIWPMLTENTVWQTNGPSTYAWGFLAAVPRS